jgi:serine/threonine-protein kinase
LLTKHITEKPVNLRQINPDVTEDFAALVMRMLEKRKEDRPRDFHDVLIQLRGMRVLKSSPVKKEEEV